MTDDDKVTVEEALKVAFEAGRQSAEAEADLFEFSNGKVVRGRGNLAEYEKAIRAKNIELLDRGIRRRADHPEVLAIKREFGRA